MEELKVILNFTSSLLWPSAFVIVAILFRDPIKILLRTVALGVSSANKMSLKLGGLQLESDILRKAEGRMEEIAKEEDIKKRLEMAKQPLLADEAMKNCTDQEIEWLKRLYEGRLDNALFLQYRRGDDNNIDFKTYERLGKLGLVDAIPSYYLDDAGWITQKGIEVLRRLKVEAPPATMKGVIQKNI